MTLTYRKLHRRAEKEKEVGGGITYLRTDETDSVAKGARLSMPSEKSVWGTASCRRLSHVLSECCMTKVKCL